MPDRTYVHAQMGRTGLGNMLLPWARAEIYRNEHGLPMLAPQWMQPKIGPLLRGETDKRFYGGLFDNSGYVRGWRRLTALGLGRRQTEQAGLPVRSTSSNRPLVVTFRGMDGMFGPLLGHHLLLHQRLMAILNVSLRERLKDEPGSRFIGVHVRRGDMPTIPLGEPCLWNSNKALPEQWFVRAIQSVREALNVDLPALVFTNARPGELAELRALPNVRLAPPNPSIVDILLLARSSVLITTGTSTFSMWAAYLGQMISVWYPGTRQRLSPLSDRQIETDLFGHIPRWPTG